MPISLLCAEESADPVGHAGGRSMEYAYLGTDLLDPISNAPNAKQELER
jgi:hypothetical protein